MPEIPDSRMWGSEQEVICPGGVPTVPTVQIARIEHERPQTWAFIFGVYIPNVLSTPSVDVRFEVTAGLGRSSIEMAVARLRCTTGGPRVFTTVGYTQGLLDPITDTLTTEVINYFPAQMIQCRAVVENAPSGGGKVYVSAYFSPLSLTPWIFK